MKLAKVIFIIIFSIIIVGITYLRIRKVNNDKEVVYLFDKEGARESGFLASEFMPTKEEIKINDSIVFKPGVVWAQHAIKLKHHLYIFSGYFEKSENNGKYLMYAADEIQNKNRLVIHPDKYDTTFREIKFSKEKDITIDSYSLPNKLLSVNGGMYDSEEVIKLDTLKFYIKQLIIEPFQPKHGKIESSYNVYSVALEKEPLDSILYVRKR